MLLNPSPSNQSDLGNAITWLDQSQHSAAAVTYVTWDSSQPAAADQVVHAVDDVHDVHPVDHVSDVFPINDVDYVDHVDDVTDIDPPQCIESRV